MNLDDVLRRIKPDNQEYEKANSAINTLMKLLDGLSAEVHGSFRKDTWLKGDTDIDVFVFFDRSLGVDWLKRDAIRILMERLSSLNPKMSYAEHPYLRVEVNGINFDVVPAFKIRWGEKPLTAVDRTSLHTDFVNSHLSDYQKDQVRLLKKFMKGIGVYGAEIKTRGFSGYVAELLIAYYGNFESVVSESSKWKHPVRIELAKCFREFKEPLIIVDPVDPDRNAASAVSLRSLATFVLACNEFMKNPSDNFFFPEQETYSVVKGDILAFEILTKDVSHDILWGQIWRSVTRIKNKLKEAGFEVIDITATESDGNLYILTQLACKNIPEYYLHVGPFYFDKDGVNKFISVNEQVWINEQGRLCTIKKRKVTDAEAIIVSNIKVNGMIGIRKVDGISAWMSPFLRKRPTWLK
ncbi:tRNA CCA-pyrophosphorylase [Sulfolobales archaeon HS-7]|nr:tRNA CCA-pyrophosphorylase [Sulfolobales archaeon HS-7]